MAEINLLKSSTSSSSTLGSLPGLVIKLLVLFVLASVVFYGYLFFRTKSLNNKIVETSAAINQTKKEALALPGREEFLIRQAQLKEFVSLSSGHVYFSKLLPALAKATLKTTYYTNFNVTNSGKLSLNVVAPDLKELDKFLQVFNQPEIRKNFYNVRLAGFNKTLIDEQSVYRFLVEMDFNGAIVAGSPATN